MFVSLAILRVRDSWLVLGPSGREHAARGADEIAQAFVADGGALAAFVARGFSGDADLVLAARAPEPPALETLWQSWAARTVGRHFDIVARRLGVGDAPWPAGAFIAWAALRGPFDDRELRDAMTPTANRALWPTLGPGPGDYLLALGADELPTLAEALHQVASTPALAAAPVNVMAVGRSLPLVEALARFA